MKEKIETIRQAMKSLGVNGKVKFKVFYGHAVIYLNGSYFGRYDFERNTFVN